MVQRGREGERFSRRTRSWLVQGADFFIPLTSQDRHQQRIDFTVTAHADKIARIEHRVAEAEAHRLREAARLKAIADEAARAQAEKDRALADKKAKAAEARARYKAKAKEKARERKEEEDRRRRAEDDEERRVAREKLKVRLSLNQGPDGGDLDDELADLDIVALAEPTGADRAGKKKSSKSRHSVAGLANLPYAANGDPLPPGEGDGDDSDFSDFENFGLDEHRAGKRRKLEHGGDRRSRSANVDDEEIDELATTDDEGSHMAVDQLPVRVGVEASGRKSRATGVGRVRPPEVRPLFDRCLLTLAASLTGQLETATEAQRGRHAGPAEEEDGQGPPVRRLARAAAVPVSVPAAALPAVVPAANAPAAVRLPDFAAPGLGRLPAAGPVRRPLLGPPEPLPERQRRRCRWRV